MGKVYCSRSIKLRYQAKAERIDDLIVRVWLRSFGYKPLFFHFSPIVIELSAGKVHELLLESRLS